jgi:hypothetical protein
VASLRSRSLLAAAVASLSLASAASAGADGPSPETHGGAETVDNTVRVTIEKSGGTYTMKPPPASSSSTPPACDYEYKLRERTDGGRPYVIKLCEGRIVDLYEPREDEVVDLDAAAAAEAGRYVDEVVVPHVVIGANPAALGLVGLPSWFWVEGWSGSVQAAPISAYGLTIDVRMSSGSVQWNFGDGTSMSGDLGQPYPARSSVRHAFQRPGTFTVTAAIALAAEYRIDGGPWITLPPLTASAAAQHAVQERQAVLIER